MYLVRKIFSLFIFVSISILFACCAKKIIPLPPPPPPPPPVYVNYDRDGDNVSDADDRCPDLPGIASLKGCPDRDGDGIADVDDKCPGVAGVVTNNGCPMIADIDRDGIIDQMEKYDTVMVTQGAATVKIRRITRTIAATNTNIEIDSIPTTLPKPRAKVSIAYGPPNATMKKGETITIFLHAQLNKSVQELQEELRTQIQKEILKGVYMGQNKKASADTLRLFAYDSLEIVAEGYDTSVFLISTTDPARQALDSLQRTEWEWKVYAKKTCKAELIILKITGVDEKGLHPYKKGRIPVTVNSDVSYALTISLIVLATILMSGLIFWLLKRKKMLRQKVFFSYKWDDKELINKIYTCLKAKGINVIKDKENLRYRGSISSFMTDLGNAKFVIVAVSDKYLKSINCMKELYHIYSNAGMNKDEFQQRIFPIPVNALDLSKSAVYNPYIQYWKQEEEKREIEINENNDTVNVEQNNELQFVRRLVNEIGNLLIYLSDINTLTLAEICNNEFEELNLAIQKAIQKKEMIL